MVFLAEMEGSRCARNSTANDYYICSGGKWRSSTMTEEDGRGFTMPKWLSGIGRGQSCIAWWTYSASHGSSREVDVVPTFALMLFWVGSGTWRVWSTPWRDPTGAGRNRGKMKHSRSVGLAICILLKLLTLHTHSAVSTQEQHSGRHGWKTSGNRT